MRCRFTRRRPLNEPPPVSGALDNGRRTPTYVLAWVCPPRKLYENLRTAKLGEATLNNCEDIIAEKWAEWKDFP